MWPSSVGGQSTYSSGLALTGARGTATVSSMTSGQQPDPWVAKLNTLSARERDILREASAGASDREIASKLVISVSTVKSHMRHILAKLEVKSRHQAADVWKNHPLTDIRAE